MVLVHLFGTRFSLRIRAASKMSFVRSIATGVASTSLVVDSATRERA
jgi:hypothetical protein